MEIDKKTCPNCKYEMSLGERFGYKVYICKLCDLILTLEEYEFIKEHGKIRRICPFCKNKDAFLVGAPYKKYLCANCYSRFDEIDISHIKRKEYKRKLEEEKRIRKMSLKDT
jgi:transposase-like protein